MILFFTGCESFGTVEQARAVGYDPQSDEVTVVLDRSSEAGEHDYRGEIRRYRLPQAHAERGPDPVAGGLLASAVDGATARLTVFDGQAVRDVVLTDVTVAAGPRADPLLDGGTLTWWDGKRLVRGHLPDDAAQLPASTWASGDEVRLYLVDPPQIARFMNVTRTDIYKK